jgi:hypothetical protein
MLLLVYSKSLAILQRGGIAVDLMGGGLHLVTEVLLPEVNRTSFFIDRVLCIQRSVQAEAMILAVSRPVQPII